MQQVMFYVLTAACYFIIGHNVAHMLWLRKTGRVSDLSGAKLKELDFLLDRQNAASKDPTAEKEYFETRKEIEHNFAYIEGVHAAVNILLRR